jgi:4-hydroxy-tetrahydrodipicolinate reductase
MGQRLVQLVTACPELALSGAVDRHDSPFFGRDAGEMAGLGPLGVAVTDDFGPAAAAAEVYLDFSSPEGAGDRARAAASAGTAAVIGVTAIPEETVEVIRSAAATVPVVLAPNMSFGVNLMYRLAADAASVLGPDYEIEIVEAHHDRKKDAPSGTALALLDRLAAARGLDPASCAVFGRHGTPGARPRDEIGVHAVRGGEIVGAHTVLFAGPGEIMEITHRAQSRDALAGGAIRAALWIRGKGPGLYTFGDVIGLKG